MINERERPTSSSGFSKVTRSLPPIIRQLKENGISVLDNQLADFFSSCDDLFFDLASKAGTNQEQNLYFDSMREIRIKKQVIQLRFKEEYEKLFILMPSNSAPQNPRFADAWASLEIVGKDETEQEVALTGIVSRIRKDCQEALYHLQLRLDFLLPGVSVTDANNPLDPKQLCEAFMHASSIADLDLKIRIIFYKQFDRKVASQFYKIYALTNELLINAGILSDIHATIVKSKSPDTAAGQNQDLPPPPPQAVPSSAQMGGQASQGQGHANGSAEANASPVNQAEAQAKFNEFIDQVRRAPSNVLPFHTANSTARPINQTDLIQAIETLGQRLSLPYEPGQGSSAIKHVIQNILLPSEKESEQRSLQKSDEDVINLVAMFFDFILDDKNLPVPIQAQIGRLQIPILKVALADRTFFSDGKHAARALINLIAKISLGWNETPEPKDDPFYALVSDIVHKIHDEYHGDMKLFSQQLERVQTFAEEESKRAALVEQRTKQTAEGKAKTEHAAKAVQQVLWKRISNQKLPPFVSRFIATYWQKVMNFVYLRHGPDSAEWIDSIQVVDDLVWVVQAHSDAKSIQRIERIMPKLIVRIHQGLKRLGTIPRPALEQLSQIKDLLVSIRQGSDSAIERKNIDDDIASNLQNAQQGTAAPSKPWKEMTAVERQQAKQTAAEYEFLKKAEKLEVGSWFIYNNPETGKSTRCKLASKITEHDQYVFVNRLGFKVNENHKKEIATHLQRGHLKVLETGILFERAMDNIMGTLRKASA